ncbi:DUF5709 domain-containing protein [Mariniluteicoccus flavus]
MADIDDQFTPDESEQLDQLEPERSLVDRNVDDTLDEGYIAPDHWSPAEGFGNTATEMREGETLEQRLKQEIPDPDPNADDPADEDLDDHEVGDRRAGRLVDANHGYPGEDTESELLGEDVGIDGAAASAEEAAMHVVDDGEDGRR